MRSCIEGARQMKRLFLGHYALNMCVAAATLSGCGGNTGSGATPPVNGASERLPFHKTFKYTGAEQMFTVPGGLKKLKVIAVGAQGGGDIQGYGGRVYAIIPVTPGEKLAIFVGGEGTLPSGGFNGGGSSGAGYGRFPGYGGGGATDIREGGSGLANRIVVVGGGGGQGSYDGPKDGIGGKGGGNIGGAGGVGSGYYGLAGGGGGGGTQDRGGFGGSGGQGQVCGDSPGDAGSLGQGGDGAEGYYLCGAGGGGGGGYYGGGGGGGGSNDGSSEATGGGGGGGGGSSYIEPSAYAYRTWTGWKKIGTADGLVVLSWQ